MLNNIAAILTGGVAASTTSYESIATVTVGAGGSSSISFSSIPSTYKHLQIRGIGKTTNASALVSVRIRLNGDTGTNYSTHYLLGQGASAQAGGAANTSSVYCSEIPYQSNTFGGWVFDILDYADINKYKTVRGFNSYDANGSGIAALISGGWRSTSAVNSLSIYGDSDNFAQYSSFALYGVKG